MKIDSKKVYKVEKYSSSDCKEYGNMTGDVVKEMLKGYEYDEILGMWFSKKAKYGYSITEQ